MLDRVYYPAALMLPTSPNSEITHLTSVSPDFNYQIHNEFQAGSLTPCFVGVSSADPTLQFTTRQLKSMLDAFTGGSSSIARSFASGTVEMVYKAGKAMDTRELDASAFHMKARMVNSSLMYWDSISVQQGSPAEMNARLVTANRGSGDPLVWLGNQAISVTGTCDRIYGLGPVYLNGSQMTGVTGWTLTSQVVPEPLTTDGAKTPNYQGIRTFNPMVTIQTNNMPELASASFGGNAFSTLILYLQHMSSTNMFAEPDSTTHIAITVNGGLRTFDSPQGSPVGLTGMFYSTRTGATPTHSFATTVDLPPS